MNQTKRGYKQQIWKSGKSTMGYFHGFKLHPVVNDKGEILNFIITQGHVDDREPIKNQSFIKVLKGKLFADTGYIQSNHRSFCSLMGCI